MAKIGRLPRPLQLKAWLKRVNKTQAELARHLDMTDSYVTQLIKNPNKNPGLVTFLRIAEFIGLDNPNDLFLMPPSPSLTANELAELARLRDSKKRHPTS